jgi:hypothetical protein
MTPTDFELAWDLCPEKFRLIGENPFSKKPYCTKKIARSVLVDGVVLTKAAHSAWLCPRDIRRMKSLIASVSEQILVRVGYPRWGSSEERRPFQSG